MTVSMESGILVREGSSTFGFPPSIHGAVGALGDVTVFYRKVNGGGPLRHRRRAGTNTINYTLIHADGYAVIINTTLKHVVGCDQ